MASNSKLLNLFRRTVKILLSICLVFLSFIVILELIYDENNEVSDFELKLISGESFKDIMNTDNYSHFDRVCFWDKSGLQEISTSKVYSDVTEILNGPAPIFEDKVWPIVLFNDTKYLIIQLQNYDLPLGTEMECCCFPLKDIHVISIPPVISGASSRRGQITITRPLS